MESNNLKLVGWEKNELLRTMWFIPAGWLGLFQNLDIVVLIYKWELRKKHKGSLRNPYQPPPPCPRTSTASEPPSIFPGAAWTALCLWKQDLFISLVMMEAHGPKEDHVCSCHRWHIPNQTLQSKASSVYSFNPFWLKTHMNAEELRADW